MLQVGASRTPVCRASRATHGLSSAVDMGVPCNLCVTMSKGDIVTERQLSAWCFRRRVVVGAVCAS